MNKEVFKIFWKGKTISRSIISSLLVITIVLSFCIIPSYAYVDKDVDNKTCLEHHFEMVGLTNSVSYYPVPPNIEGSCGYVAMSMLLSYYDTYWDNRFVPENLEWNKGEYNFNNDRLVSTFTAEDENSELYREKTENSEYRFTDFVDEYKNTFLQEYLINLDRSSNPFLLIPNFFAMLDTNMYNAFCTYLYEECGFSEDEITVNILREAESSDAELSEVMKEQINNGNPVIYFGFKIDFDINNFVATDWSDKGAHFMIAYDVDTHNGVEDIKLNTGWNTNQTEKTRWVNTCEFNKFNSIIWLEINEENMPHRCDDNYVDSVTGEYLCSCEIYGYSHPGHANHNYISSSFDGFYHWLECKCGDRNQISNHNLTYLNGDLNGQTHYESCNDCLYFSDVQHNYNILSNPTENGHCTACACGQVGEIEEHYYYSYARNDTLKHHVYCECGHYIGTSFHVVSAQGVGLFKICIHCGEKLKMNEVIVPVPGGGIQSTNQITYITEDGSYVDGNGIIYLVESDMALYLAGELDVYALAENVFGAVKQ